MADPEGRLSEPLRAAERTAWERRQECEPPRARLRYEVVYAIDMPEGCSNSIGFTDDLGFAIWSAERVPDPCASVYDHQERRYAGGPEPGRLRGEGAFLEYRIAVLLAELTPPDPPGLKYVGPRAPEPVLAPLRAARYVALGMARAEDERERALYGPMRLASYPDGRDLEPGYHASDGRALGITCP